MSMPSCPRSLRPSDTIVSPLFWAFNSRNVRVAAAMAVASIFACEGQRKDPRGACVDKDARASVQGGAGRDHVVDKENAALRDALSRLEDALSHKDGHRRSDGREAAELEG